MKEVEKKDAPEVSGGYTGFTGDDPSLGLPSTSDFPKFPTTPIDIAEGDLPIGSR